MKEPNPMNEKAAGALPPEAQAEILDRLFGQMSISRAEIDDIMERHGVSGDTDALQKSYRRRKAQRFIASLQDRDGVRVAMAVKGGQYVVVDCFNDKARLASLHNRIENQINGLNRSDGKVRKRIDILDWLTTRFKKAG